MTRDEIARMAREAGFTVVDSVDPQCWAGDHAADDESLERFFKLAYEAGAAAEREKAAAWMRQRDEWARDRLARHGIPFPGDDNGRDPV